MTSRSRPASAVCQLLGTLAAGIARAIYGSGEPALGRVRRAVLVGGCLLAGWLVTATPALAALGHKYLCQITGTSPGSASECNSGGSAVPGGLVSPYGITISNGNAWVADPANNVVDEFDSTGAAVFQQTGAGNFGSGYEQGVAVNDSTQFSYVADSGADLVDVFDNTGAFVAQWNGSTTPSGSFGASFGYVYTAVDNSGGPSSGDVYVTDSNHGVIDKLDGSGNPVSFSGSASYISGSQITGTPTGQGFSELQGIAVDAAGNIYAVAQGTGVVDEFDQTGTFVQQFTGAGTPSGSFGSIVGVGVDNATGNVFVVDNADNVVDEFSSSGAYLGDVTGAGTPASSFNGPQGVAVDAAGDVYVTDGGNHVVDEFAPVVLPAVTTGQASAVTSTSATLNGTVNPEGTTISDCHFDYVDDADYSLGGPNPYSAGQTAPCVPDAASIPPDSNGHAVSAGVSGLQADTTYHFRLVANSNSAEGADVTFHTGGVPLIDGAWTSNLTDSSVDLNADINPKGLDTTYHFEWGTADCSSHPCASVPVPDADIGSGQGDVAVTQPISGLSANTTYHWRVVAVNAAETTTGVDHTFVYQTGTPSGAGCPNAQLRAGYSAYLPDCRAYEQVTPADKGDGQLWFLSGGSPGAGGFQASSGGDRMAYTTLLPFPGFQAGAEDQDLATRGAGGWSSQGLIPPQAPTTDLRDNPGIVGYSPDLSQAALVDGGAAGQDDPALVSGEPANNQNLFVRDDSTGSYQLVDVTPPGVTPAAATFDGASTDYSHIFFQSSAQLTPDAPAGGPQSLYEWVGGAVRLVSQIPTPPATACGAGGPACTASAGGGHAGGSTFAGGVAGRAVNAVSPDGSKVIFTDSGTDAVPGQLYLRESGATTVQLSASQRTSGAGPGPLFPTYWAASADDSKVFFTSCEQLTDDSTAVYRGSSIGQTQTCDQAAASAGWGLVGSDLYQYDTASGRLTDLTVDPHPSTDQSCAAAEGSFCAANVQGVLGASADGSSVYFVANGVLAAGASAGNCTGLYGAVDQTCNLYVARDGTVTFIAQLGSADFNDWNGARPQSVSADGTHLAFQSVHSLTGYDNTVSGGGTCLQGDTSPEGGDTSQCFEVYLYDATTSTLTCPSCDASGARPIGASWLTLPVELGPNSAPASLAINVPRSLSSDGSRLFFNSYDPLVRRDTNGTQADVYEYEQDGAGGCASAGGCIYLISSGTGSDASEFLDASSSGDDVFFDTTQQLVPQDTDQQYDIYDARVGGGFPAPPTPTAPCSGDACKGTLSGAPGVSTAASVTFSGPGNAKSGSAPAKPRVLTRTVHGATFLVKVKVPGAGRITITGAGIRTVHRSVSKAGTYKLRVTLTAKEKRLLKHQRKLRLTLQVRYTPSGGASSVATVRLTVEPALRHTAARRARAASHNVGGAR